MPRTEWVTDEAGFAELAPRWEALAAAQEWPFLRHPWLTAWWDAFAAGRALRVLTAWEGEELRGGLALCEGRGGRLEAMANIHSPSFGALAADPAAMGVLADAVLARGVELTLPCLPAGDPLLAALGAGRPLVAEPWLSSPTVELTGDAAVFRAETKPRWGAPLERFRRKMARDHGAQPFLVEAPADLDAELAEGFRVEASGWKGEAGTAITSAPDTERFYRAMAHAMLDAGTLRTAGIRFGDGELVAWDLLVLHAGRLHLLKTGFDERHRKLAPGLVLRLSVIERCYELGLLSHELGGAAEPWKLKFADAERPFVTARSYPRAPAATTRYAYRRAVRPLLRRAYHAARRRAA